MKEIICPSCGAHFDIQKEIQKDLQEKVLEKEKELKTLYQREKELEVKNLTKNLKSSIQEELLNEYSKKDQEREFLISNLRKEVVSLKVKLEQGSQQLQGEIQEVNLELFLKNNYRLDDIGPVPKGVNGADLIQKVRSSSGKDLGIILWESKRTKSFSNDWVHKLKKDMREISAHVGVIVSEIMPQKSNEKIMHMDGIWVIHPTMVKGVTDLLRKNIQEVMRAKRFSVESQDKAHLLYDYLTSHQFRHRLESIIDSFTKMKGELEKEKKAYLRNFKMREKEIDLLMENAVEMVGEIQGTIGGKEFSIPSLEISPMD